MKRLIAVVLVSLFIGGCPKRWPPQPEPVHKCKPVSNPTGDAKGCTP